MPPRFEIFGYLADGLVQLAEYLLIGLAALTRAGARLIQIPRRETVNAAEESE